MTKSEAISSYGGTLVWFKRFYKGVATFAGDVWDGTHIEAHVEDMVTFDSSNRWLKDLEADSLSINGIFCEDES